MLYGIRLNILLSIMLVFGTIFMAFGIENLVYSVIFLILGGLALFAAIRYTVGGQAYGYRGLGDIMVFLFFGLLSVIGSYFLFAKQLDHVTLLPACSIGLLSAAVLNLNNMRDIKGDELAGKRTMAVKMGWAKAKRYHAFLIIAAMALGLAFGILYYTAAFNLIYLITYIPLIRHLLYVKRTEDPAALDSQLKVLAMTTFLFALLLGVGHIYNAI